MTGREFKEALRRTELSMYAGAQFLGLSLRHCQRIAAGEYEAPLAVGKLLRLMVSLRLTARDVK